MFEFKDAVVKLSCGIPVRSLDEEGKTYDTYNDLNDLIVLSEEETEYLWDVVPTNDISLVEAIVDLIKYGRPFRISDIEGKTIMEIVHEEDLKNIMSNDILITQIS